LITRGNALYGVNCRLCHGSDLRGGDQGGPNLLRSAVVFDDQNGELIGPVVSNGRNNEGMPTMPKFTLPADDVRAIAEYIHSVMGTLQGQGGPPRGTPAQLDILVGNAAAGQAYFAKNCATCHSITGDLQGIGSRAATPMALQNGWLGGNIGGALEEMIARDERGGVPRIYFATLQSSAGQVDGRDQYMDAYWRFYLTKHRRTDLLARTARFDGGAVNAMPAGSLVLANVGNTPVDALVSAHQLHPVTTVDELDGTPFFVVLQR